MLLLALGWLYRQRSTWLADQWSSDLASVPDEKLVERLRQAADLGEPGILALAEALCSSRRALAEAAAEVLDEELHRWAVLPPSETISRRTALAESLAARIDGTQGSAVGSEGRSRAADVAARLLTWPADPRVPGGRVTLACERVLRARPSP
jgi:hypothetical protein